MLFRAQKPLFQFAHFAVNIFSTKNWMDFNKNLQRFQGNWSRIKNVRSALPFQLCRTRSANYPQSYKCYTKSDFLIVAL
jgi:hypothetical protein